MSSLALMHKNNKTLPDRNCLMRPLLLVVSTGKKSLNQVISGSGFPLAAHNMVAVRVRSTTFNCGPISMVGKPEGSWSSETHENKQGIYFVAARRNHAQFNFHSLISVNKYRQIHILHEHYSHVRFICLKDYLSLETTVLLTSTSIHFYVNASYYKLQGVLNPVPKVIF